jgi:hypothetical protein
LRMLELVGTALTRLCPPYGALRRPHIQPLVHQVETPLR